MVKTLKKEELRERVQALNGSSAPPLFMLRTLKEAIKPGCPLCARCIIPDTVTN